jgi:hypothetical protein
MQKKAALEGCLDKLFSTISGTMVFQMDGFLSDWMVGFSGIRWLSFGLDGFSFGSDFRFLRIWIKALTPISNRTGNGCNQSDFISLTR